MRWHWELERRLRAIKSVPSPRFAGALSAVGLVCGSYPAVDAAVQELSQSRNTTVSWLLCGFGFFVSGRQPPSPARCSPCGSSGLARPWSPPPRWAATPWPASPGAGGWRVSQQAWHARTDQISKRRACQPHTCELTLSATYSFIRLYRMFLTIFRSSARSQAINADWKSPTILTKTLLKPVASPLCLLGHFPLVP